MVVDVMVVKTIVWKERMGTLEKVMAEEDGHKENDNKEGRGGGKRVGEE